MCPINRIESATALKPLEWYQAEITKTGKELHDLYQAYYKALKNYNGLMVKNFCLAYNLSKVSNFKDKFSASLKYKEDYENVKNAYLECADIYTRILCTTDVLNTLKKERADNYGKSRNQDN